MAQMQFYDPRLRNNPQFQQAYASVSAINGQRLRSARDALLGFGRDVLLDSVSTLNPSLRSMPLFSDAHQRMEGRVVSAVSGVLHTAQDLLFDLAAVHDNLLYDNPGAAGRSLADAGFDGGELALDVFATRGAIRGVRLVEAGPALIEDDIQALIPRARLSRTTLDALGPAPSDMLNPHIHHILPLNGRAGVERALIREGQSYLREVNIDPVVGVENLAWAPNTGHTIAASRAVVDDLRLVRGSRQDILDVLNRHARIARGR
jgi:hypothetical protein